MNKNIFANQLDPEENLSQMERAKAEVEKRVSKILKFIQNKNKIPKDLKNQLLGLVKDLHEQCQSLYLVLDDLRDESDGETRGKRGKWHSASSTSSSDLEYYSSEEIDNKSSNLNQVVESTSFKEEIGTSSFEVADLKHKLETLNLEYVAAFRKLQEAEVMNKNLRNEAEEKERVLCMRTKELEGQIGDVKAELQAQYYQNGDLEEQIVKKVNEAKQLSEKNKGLQSRISELELILKEKGDEISNTKNTFGINKNKLTSTIDDLKTQVNDLQLEVDFLRAQKGELAGSMEGKRNEELDQFKGLMDRVNTTQNELESLRNQKTELQCHLDMKTNEVSQIQNQFKCLDEELVRKAKVERIMAEEKEGLQIKLQNLEQEVISLCEQKKESDEQIKSKIPEKDRLREEKERLLTRIAVFDSLQTQKSELESQIKTEKQNLAQMEDTNMKISNRVADQQTNLKDQEDAIHRLTSKIKDQQRLLKEQKDVIDKLTEDQKIIKRWSFGSTRDSKLNFNLLERKMEELAEDFRMKMEDHLRILYRRIHVAEQIHIESKNNYRETRDTTEGRENRKNLAFCETQFKKIKNMLQPVYAGSELALKKLDETGSFVTRISKIINEIQSARNWVTEKNNEVDQLKHEIETLVAQLECREAQESLLKEKLSKLEAKLAEQGTEKLNLTKVLRKFEMKVREMEIDVKAKDVELLNLGEEKREAIRQLCVLLDYQRSRFDNLKRSISKITLKA